MKNVKLEFIRGIASLMVFFCHCELNSPALQSSRLYHYLFNWGTESVIVFFILSGIVIQISQESNPKSANQFMINRFKRLYPAYIIGLALAFLFVPIDFKMIVGNLFFLGSLQNYIVPVPLYNTVVWSLSFEMFFFLMFYLYLATGSKKIFMALWIGLSLICIPIYYMHVRGPLGQLIALLAFSPIWLLGYFTSRYISKFPRVSIHQVFFSFGLLFLAARITITSEFYCILRYLIFSVVSLPIFIYCLLPADKPGKQLNWIYCLLCYAILLVLIQVSSDSLRSSKIIYSICAPFFYVISFLLVPAIKKILLQAGFFLGFISYSLYMIHYPLLHFLTTIVGNINGQVFLAIAVITIIPLAYALELITKRVFSKSRKPKVQLNMQA